MNKTKIGFSLLGIALIGGGVGLLASLSSCSKGASEEVISIQGRDIIFAIAGQEGYEGYNVMSNKKNYAVGNSLGSWGISDDYGKFSIVQGILHWTSLEASTDYSLNISWQNGDYSALYNVVVEARVTGSLPNSYWIEGIEDIESYIGYASEIEFRCFNGDIKVEGGTWSIVQEDDYQYFTFNQSKKMLQWSNISLAEARVYTVKIQWHETSSTSSNGAVLELKVDNGVFPTNAIPFSYLDIDVYNKELKGFIQDMPVLDPSIDTLLIPGSTVNVIIPHAFDNSPLMSGSGQIKIIKMGKNVDYINTDAFARNSAIKEVYLQNTRVLIDDTFKYCYGLELLDLGWNPDLELSNGCFQETHNLSTIITHAPSLNAKNSHAFVNAGADITDDSGTVVSMNSNYSSEIFYSNLVDYHYLSSSKFHYTSI